MMKFHTTETQTSMLCYVNTMHAGKALLGGCRVSYEVRSYISEWSLLRCPIHYREEHKYALGLFLMHPTRSMLLD